jgi:aldehyde dehydrogenase (NAD+)
MNKNNNNARFYIDGVWVAPAVPKLFDLVNPATEESIGAISLGSIADVDRAVVAARKAFATYSQTSKQERLAFLRNIIACYKARFDDIARAITEEMGSPLWFSKKVQVQTALDHFEEACRVLEAYEFEHMMGGTRIVREPIGVCGLITPWNWPHHAMELAGQSGRLQAGAGPGGRVHGCGQAERNGAAEFDHPGGGVA